MPSSNNPLVVTASQSTNGERLSSCPPGLAGVLAATALVVPLSALGGEGASFDEPPAGVADTHCGAALLSVRMTEIAPMRAVALVAGVKESELDTPDALGVLGVQWEDLPLGAEATFQGSRTVGMTRSATAGTWPLVETRAGLRFCSTCPSENSRFPLNRCSSSVQRRAWFWPSCIKLPGGV